MLVPVVAIAVLALLGYFLYSGKASTAGPMQPITERGVLFPWTKGTQRNCELNVACAKQGWITSNATRQTQVLTMSKERCKNPPSKIAIQSYVDVVCSELIGSKLDHEIKACLASAERNPILGESAPDVSQIDEGSRADEVLKRVFCRAYLINNQNHTYLRSFDPFGKGWYSRKLKLRADFPERIELWTKIANELYSSAKSSTAIQAGGQ